MLDLGYAMETVSNGRHLRYFSVDMIRHHDQDSNKTRHLIWDPQFQRVRVHHHHRGALAAGRHRAGTVTESLHLNP